MARREFRVSGFKVKSGIHTVGYNPFIKSELASRNKFEGQIWSRETPEPGSNETLAVGRVEVQGYLAHAKQPPP